MLLAGKTEIKSWLMDLMASGLAASSVNRKLVALSTFYNYQIREELLDSNPVDGVPRPKQPKRLAKFIDRTTVDKVFAPDQFSDDFYGLRQRLIMELLYATGIRVSELMGIRHADVDTSRSEIKVLGKGNKERHIPISSDLIGRIQVYASLKADLGLPFDFLLVTDKGKQLYPMFVSRQVKDVLKGYANITKTNPHILRHTFATHLLNNGGDINAIKDLLGHASLASTSVYTHNSIERLKDVYKNTHPRK